MIERYRKSLKTLQKRGLNRERAILDTSLIDFASNDYLGFSQREDLLNRAIDRLKKESVHSPRASMLVNGYHKVHKDFEDRLKESGDFEAGVVVGSGFLANFGMIESLVRAGDTLLMDQHYHSSGVVATRLFKESSVQFFKHNSPEDLENRLKNTKGGAIIAVEGVYSMEGTLLKKEFFEIADRYGAVLIVDEAHSFGVVGDRLQGVFDLYNIKPKENHIKMGTLGKAMGSYGSYILGSEDIISFMINRSKPIIYSTALSLFDTLLGDVGLEEVQNNREALKREISERKTIVENSLQREVESLIIPIELKSVDEVNRAKDYLKERGFLVGGIRPPTVERPILRVIPRLGSESDKLRELLQIIERREWF